jgi:hypothetical protein
VQIDPESRLGYPGSKERNGGIVFYILMTLIKRLAVKPYENPENT